MKKLMHFFFPANDGDNFSLRLNMPKHEGFLLLCVMITFLAFPWLSRHIDITSAPVDPGALSIVIMAVLAFLVFKSFTWLLLQVIWPVFAEYSEWNFEDDFVSLPALYKVLIYLSFYLLLLFGFVGALAAVG